MGEAKRRKSLGRSQPKTDTLMDSTTVSPSTTASKLLIKNEIISDVFVEVDRAINLEFPSRSGRCMMYSLIGSFALKKLQLLGIVDANLNISSRIGGIAYFEHDEHGASYWRQNLDEPTLDDGGFHCWIDIANNRGSHQVVDFGLEIFRESAAVKGRIAAFPGEYVSFLAEVSKVKPYYADRINKLIYSKSLKLDSELEHRAAIAHADLSRIASIVAAAILRA